MIVDAISGFSRAMLNGVLTQGRNDFFQLYTDVGKARKLKI